MRNVADGIATVELADGKVAKVGLDKGITSDVVFNDPKAENLFRIATDRVGKVDGWTTETANAMIKGYDGTTSDVDYRKAYTMAFDMGKEGVETSQVVSLANKSGVKGATLLGAYDMGRQATEKTLTNTAQSGKIESEVKTDESTNTYLRNGSEWNGSANPEGQVSILEESTGRDTSREDAGRKVADSEAVKLVNEGQKVRVADLGILNGSKTQTVTVVDKSQETAEMTKAREKAESRGVKVRFFLGDNLVIEENGELISARAYIKGDYVFVRADHPLYTADQLMSHEMGHDMVAKGEVDINKVRERLAETVGKENVDLVADMYELAYRGSNLSADEIWEECVCDSLGNMNVFSGKAEIDQGIMTMVLADIKKATEDAKTAPNKTRGAPDGNTSRETTSKSDLMEETEVYEKRKETRDEFNRTAYEENCTVGERGEIAYAYKISRKPSLEGQKVAEEVEKLGIKALIYDILKSNYKNVTTVYKGGAVSIGKVGIFINNDIERNPIETAGHEAFHYLRGYVGRTDLVDTIVDNIKFSSNDFINFVSKIEDGYFNEEVEIDGDSWHLLNEEICAYIVGHIYAGDVNNEVRPFIRNYSEIEMAISHFFKSQKAGKTSRELDSLGNELTKEQAEFFKDSKVTQGIR